MELHKGFINTDSRETSENEKQDFKKERETNILERERFREGEVMVKNL